MKTDPKTKKKFDAVKMMRDIREKIDTDTEGMNYDEIAEYYKNSSKENQKKHQANA